MGSRGSVIPLFISQIKKGKPITITDPNMTRFLMSLEDSVDLVTYAFEHAQQGDIFVQKSPSSTISDLAKAIAELIDKESKTEIIGTRHGEKLYETLVSREEMASAEDLGEYYRIPADNRDLNYSKYFDKGNKSISLSEDYTSHNTVKLTTQEIKKLLIKHNLIEGAIHD